MEDCIAIEDAITATPPSASTPVSTPATAAARGRGRPRGRLRAPHPRNIAPILDADPGRDMCTAIQIRILLYTANSFGRPAGRPSITPPHAYTCTMETRDGEV